MTDQNKSFVDRIIGKAIDVWWGRVAVGLGLYWVSYDLYKTFSELESGERESVWGGKLFITTYKLFGKWPLVVGLTVFGTLLLGWGIAEVASRKKDAPK